MPETDSGPLRVALAQAIAALSGTDRLVVVAAGADGVVRCHVRRDESGTPCGYRRRPVAWADLLVGTEGDLPGTTDAERELLGVAGLPAAGPVILVFAPDGDDSRADRVRGWLRAARPDAPVFRSGTPIGSLITEAIANDPLCQPYDLVVLRPAPDTGRLRLGGLRLFGSGAKRGSSAQVSVRCGPDGGMGTVFAVVTWDGGVPRLVVQYAARLGPGKHTLTARLERPGLVRFVDPEGFVPAEAGWGELVAMVPPELPGRVDSAHLICAVEVYGTAAEVAERLSRISQIVTVAGGSGDLQASLIAYGPHSYDWRTPDRPVEVLAWAASPAEVAAGVDRLARRGVPKPGYPYHPDAAQLEDMLATVTGLLREAGPGPRAARTVLLTVGARPPHPPEDDPSRLLPCPRHHDWAGLVRYLTQKFGLAFAAICDAPPEPASGAWALLGRDLLAQTSEVDVRGLGPALGLTSAPPTPVPFPLLDEP
ncbi:hypothetical protein [Acrocarpospora phusangensis]|uniref:hypothetical protein n=1 Tax=Acrocarpospora phusangensis TaxID=1070424 RepID=UPI00194F2CEB|nr:hypothetical protein [Acrocarpospora phusangensis]